MKKKLSAAKNGQMTSGRMRNSNCTGCGVKKNAAHIASPARS